MKIGLDFDTRRLKPRAPVIERQPLNRKAEVTLPIGAMRRDGQFGIVWWFTRFFGVEYQQDTCTHSVKNMAVSDPHDRIKPEDIAIKPLSRVNIRHVEGRLKKFGWRCGEGKVLIRHGTTILQMPLRPNRPLANVMLLGAYLTFCQVPPSRQMPNTQPLTLSVLPESCNLEL